MLLNNHPKRDTFGVFDAQLVDRYIQVYLPKCCTNSFSKKLVYWLLSTLSLCVLYFEIILREIYFIFIIYSVITVVYSIIMKSLSILLFPMYFRYFKKSKFSTFISFRRRNKRRSPSMRRNNDYKIFETKLGGKVKINFIVYFDV